MYVYVHEFTRYRQRGGTSPLKVNPEVITPRRREEVLRPSPREERRPRPTLKRVFFFLKNSTYFNSFGRWRVSILTRVSLASSYAVTRRFCASRILPRIRIFFSSFPFVFFTPEKPVTSFQSDDGKIMDTISIRHRDYLSQLFTVPADVVLYRCLLNHTSFFFSRFVSLKLISATINHNETRDESRINEISRHRILFVLSLSFSLLNFLSPSTILFRIFESNRSIDQRMRQIPLCFYLFFFFV